MFLDLGGIACWQCQVLTAPFDQIAHKVDNLIVNAAETVGLNGGKTRKLRYASSGSKRLSTPH